MLALGITFQFGIQAILNICVVTNTIPNTGISLPFFSFGGTALIMLLAEMGVLLSVSRHSNTEKNVKRGIQLCVCYLQAAAPPATSIRRLRRPVICAQAAGCRNPVRRQQGAAWKSVLCPQRASISKPSASPGFQRKLTAKNIRRNIKTVFRLFSSSIESERIIKAFKPDICVGTGGYVSGPVIRAAQKLGIPTVIHEQNAYPGMTTKALAKHAECVMLAVEDAKKVPRPQR